MLIIVQIDYAVFYRLVAARYERISGIQDCGAVHTRIIERVSADDLGLIIGIAVAEARGVIVHPRNLPAVFFHSPDVTDVFQIGYSMIEHVEEACKHFVAGSGRYEVGGRTDPIERIDDEYRWFRTSFR